MRILNILGTIAIAALLAGGGALGAATNQGGGVVASNLPFVEGTPRSCIQAYIHSSEREGLIEQNEEACATTPSTYDSREICERTGDRIDALVDPILTNTGLCFQALENEHQANVQEVAAKNGYDTQKYKEVEEAVQKYISKRELKPENIDGEIFYDAQES